MARLAETVVSTGRTDSRGIVSLDVALPSEAPRGVGLLEVDTHESGLRPACVATIGEIPASVDLVQPDLGRG